MVFSTGVFAGGDTPQIIIKDFKFIPQEITIKRGQTINWENREKRQYHSVWFEASGEEEPDYIFPDETYEREFEKTGSFMARSNARAMCSSQKSSSCIYSTYPSKRPFHSPTARSQCM